jgi:hypothetical protein
MEELYTKFTSGDGDKDNKGLFGKFDFRKDVGDDTVGEVVKRTGNRTLDKIVENVPGISEVEKKDTKKAFGAVLDGMSIMDAAKIFGLGTAGLGLLIDLTNEQGDVGAQADTMPEGNVLQGIVNPIGVFPELQTRADGGIMDLQDGGESVGPGTGT